MNSNTFPRGSFTPNTRNMILVCIGDSGTSLNESILGNLADNSRNWTVLVRQQLGIRLINKGISGQTASQIQARFHADVVALTPKPTHCIIEVGGNDTLQGVPLETTMSKINLMVKMAKKNNIIPLLMCCGPGHGSLYWYQINNVPNAFDWEGVNYFPKFRAAEKLYCLENDVDYIDQYSPFAPGGIPIYDYNNYFTNERLHFNASGNMILAKVVCDALQQYL